jgi:surfactin synthase thioesterase subunit
MTEKEFLFEVILPIIRADFTISDLYKYKPQSKIKTKITAIGGKEDDTFEPKNMLGWYKQTNTFAYKYFNGDHFFINSSYKEVIDFLNNILFKELKKR